MKSLEGLEELVGVERFAVGFGEHEPTAIAASPSPAAPALSGFPPRTSSTTSSSATPRPATPPRGTVDTALVLVDTPTDSRGIYTPMTRGRFANHACVVIDENETA